MTCGECKHFSTEIGDAGWCLVATPMWVDQNAGRTKKSESATDCPCFERKEGE